MQFFQRDNRFYIGPLSDSKIEIMQANKIFSDTGIAAIAGDGKVDVFLTLPADDNSTKLLYDVKKDMLFT
jgi:hypothetical protein